MIWTAGDMFCGGGGTTSGIINSKYAKVIWAINHDAKAIASHAANHPETIHYTEDIVKKDISSLPKVNILWASLECTHFSNAKGGDSRDADSRMLAEQMYRYADQCDPDYIIIENVKEFLTWGPLKQKLDKEGKPIFKQGKPVLIPDVDEHCLGMNYKQWVYTLKKRGYNYRYKLLNAADYGAYTSRLRYFGIFAKEGLPLRFPSPTHNKTGIAGLQKWKAVKDVLNFEEEGESIFGRKKPLVEKTLARIYAGLQKYITAGDSAFITKYLGNDQKTGINNGIRITNPCPVITTQNRLGLVQANFLMKYHGSGDNVMSVEGPASTITTKDRLAKIKLYVPENSFLVKYNHNDTAASVQHPCPTLLTKDRMALLQVDRKYFITKQYNSEYNNQSVQSPAGTLTINPKLALIEATPKRFLLNPQFNNIGQTLDKPCPTIMASKRYHYLVNSYLGADHLHVQETDSQYTKLIKQFMQQNGITDIKMRMLNVEELKVIQGFPKDYILYGTQTDQKKFIGNSVVPIVAEKIIEALWEANFERREVAA